MAKPLVIVFLAATLLFGSLVFGAKVAVADEFKVGILLDSSLNDPAQSTFMQGFQLAVDQSPDVSHPPGEEGGDHLGSMDVATVVVDDQTGSSALLAAAVGLLERESVDIIIANVAPDALPAIFDLAVGSGTMLIVASELGGQSFLKTPFFFAAAEQGRAEGLLTDRSPAFSSAFASAYSLPASDAAASGYIAGRLVDLAVEATDRDPSDVQTMSSALLAATNALSPPPTNVGNDQTAETDASTIDPASQKASKTYLTLSNVLLAISAALLIALVGWRYRPRR